jgi:hypothetical protein
MLYSALNLRAIKLIIFLMKLLYLGLLNTIFIYILILKFKKLYVREYKGTSLTDKPKSLRPYLIGRPYRLKWA